MNRVSCRGLFAHGGDSAESRLMAGRPMRAASRASAAMLPAALAVLALILCGCRAPGPTPARKSFVVMGTFASLAIPPDSPADVESMTILLSDTLAGLEEKMSVYKPGSEISMINAGAGRAPVTASQDTLNLLKLVRYYCEISEGAFDPTVGPLMEAWGLKGAAPVPAHALDHETVASLLQRVGWKSLIVSESAAFLEKPGMALDLGGIAKGYAVDVCCHQLLGLGVQNALVDIGGNMRGLGFRGGNEPWVVGVRNPFRSGRILGTMCISNGEAVATSGNYERFVSIEGKRYAHVIDPRSGRPVEGMAAVTVVSHSAAEADALSTALFVLGTDKGIEALKRTASSEAMFVPDRQPLEIIVTPALARRFRPDPAVSNRVFLADF